jgi:hypothetical protein
MKKNIITTIILIATFSSCSDFLDIKPQTTLPTGNFFKTQTDFEQAVTGIYAPLQAIYNQDWQLTELRSDNTYFIYNIGNRGGKPTEDIATFTVETNNATVINQWTNDYLVIARANEMLAKIDGVTFTQTVKDNLKGQALFLRAFAYFDLVRKFGGVPLFLIPPTSYKETFKKRSTAAEVYDQIIKDAKDAALLLPTKTVQTIGRPSSGAANTLLADVYMMQGKWAEAETALLTVTTMGYSLLPNYADIFKPTNKGNNEVIFDIGYVTGTAQPLFNAAPYAFLPATPNPAVITGVSPANANGGGSLNIPTPELIAAYESQVIDTRFSASIGFFTGAGALVGIPTYTNQPYVKKYLHPHAVYGQTDVNWPVYRYAEVLLMLAECLNEQNKTGALGYLNQVRTRAGLANKASATQAALKDDILQERRVELAFENKRWFDLIRAGKAVSVMSAFGASVKANPQNYYYVTGNIPPPNSFNITPNLLVYPIPVTEIVVNSELTQNPGY